MTVAALYWKCNPKIKTFLNKQIQIEMKNIPDVSTIEKSAMTRKVYSNYLKALWKKLPDLKRSIKANTSQYCIPK